MLYHAGDSPHTQNTQINKVIGENEKCVFILRKKLNERFGQLNMLSLPFSMWGNRHAAGEQLT